MTIPRHLMNYKKGIMLSHNDPVQISAIHVFFSYQSIITINNSWVGTVRRWNVLPLHVINSIINVFSWTSRVPVDGKSSLCLICMTCRIIILIIIIISLGELLLSHIANTSRTHARTHALTHARTHTRTHAHAHTHTHTRTHMGTHTHTHTLRRIRSGSMRRWRQIVTKLTPLFACYADIHGR